ncbi:phosphatidylinositol-glycan biosynthesis class S protein-domain-containing protein [Terfezia claveryi]|nr:phosphatidylinositol-glycan biosynthesis class S protein-domain-containing protein [Terfezia claveryi]
MVEGKDCKIEFPLLVDLRDSIRNVQLHLDDAREVETGGGHLRLRLAEEERSSEACPYRSEELCTWEGEGANGSEEDIEVESVAEVLRLLPGGPWSTEHTHSLQPSQWTIDLSYPSTYNPASSASLASLSSYAAKMLQMVFREAEQMQPGDFDMSRKIARMIRYSSRYHITFSLFTASAIPSSWDIIPAIETYLTPLLTALSPISNFTVESRCSFMRPSHRQSGPLLNEELNAWTLTEDDLSNFINSAKWPLTSIKSDPTISFIIYIPDKSLSPLIIPESTGGGNAWLLPQWGGVAILNPKTEVEANITVVHDPPAHLTLDDLKPSLDIFATQLLALLGTPSDFSVSSSLPIRIDSLTRQRTAETLLSASTTLGSLALSISVSKTITALERSCAVLKEGRFNYALKEGRIAAEEAEKAFFERTMVALALWAWFKYRRNAAAVGATKKGI